MEHPLLNHLKSRVTGDEDDHFVAEPLKLLTWANDPSKPQLIYIFEGAQTGNIYLYPATTLPQEYKLIKVYHSTSRYFMETPRIRKEILADIRKAEDAEYEQAKAADRVSHEIIDGKEHITVWTIAD